MAPGWFKQPHQLPTALSTKIVALETAAYRACSFCSYSLTMGKGRRMSEGFQTCLERKPWDMPVKPLRERWRM